MSGPTVHDPLTLTIGDTWTIPGTARNADGSAMDLTGALVEWFLDDIPGTTGYLRLTSDDGVIVAAGSGGDFTVVVTSAANGALAGAPIKDFKDTLRVTLPSGAVSTQWVGPITVMPAPKAPAA